MEKPEILMYLKRLEKEILEAQETLNFLLEQLEVYDRVDIKEQQQINKRK